MVVDNHYIKNELLKVGISINGIYDLVNTRVRYPEAVPLLIDIVDKKFDDIHIQEGVVRALTVKEATGKANATLLSVYNNTSKEKDLFRWIIGNAFNTIITKNDIEEILQIIQDKTNGESRQMFVLALGKVKPTQAEDILIDLLDDDDVLVHTISTLGRMKSQRAREKILLLNSHSKTFIRNSAKAALKKIDTDRA